MVLAVGLWFVLLLVAMTMTFEFLGGHYLFKQPWERLLADYNLSAGRIWVVVLIATLLAPLLTRR
ncbi:MAG: hypothetical protein ABL986_13765 [Vicinamibacterales bacterium]